MTVSQCPYSGVNSYIRSLRIIPINDFGAKFLLEDRILLEQRETNLEGQDEAQFLRLIQKMLQWESQRSVALLWSCKRTSREYALKFSVSGGMDVYLRGNTTRKEHLRAAASLIKEEAVNPIRQCHWTR
ncbi:hypothetical protein ACJ72_06753 [Emergomyces africanus]|uniref:Uncharacterized protein n=1 Tax=Emergomyces africanus TaxID=1955775 RepID=A0A1B7NQ30_9EURO|nr:hypothetical protein ACJ72_06753 [Emergomyces africanus]